MALEMKIRFIDVLQDGSFRNTRANGKLVGFQVDVRLGYYRGHYLSTIDHLSLEIDEKPIDENDITFCLHGKEFAPSELKYVTAEFWPILQPATLKILHSGGLTPGEHKIDLKLILRCPYLPLPGSKDEHAYVAIDSCEQKTMMLTKTG